MTGVEIATVVSIGINLIGGFFLKRKAKQAKLLPVVIRGVEAAAASLAAGKAIKDSIRDAATAAGVEPELNKEVKRVTRLVAFRRP